MSFIDKECKHTKIPNFKFVAGSTELDEVKTRPDLPEQQSVFISWKATETECRHNGANEQEILLHSNKTWLKIEKIVNSMSRQLLTL